MKHIFKKLHIGSNHDPTRSNDPSPPPPSSVSPTCAAAAVQSPVSPPPSTSPPSSAETAATTPVSAAVNRQQDYYSSEEEYQVQLALALSVSGPNSDGNSNRDKDQIRVATWQGRDAAADLLSRQYWVSWFNLIAISILTAVYYSYVLCLVVSLRLFDRAKVVIVVRIVRLTPWNGVKLPTFFLLAPKCMPPPMPLFV